MTTLIHAITANSLRAPMTTAQLFGIEMEIENVPRRYSSAEVVIDGWHAVHDGSLRNNGVEFVTRPVTIARANELLGALYAVKRASGMRSSIRTSMHVHVDMRNDTFTTLFGVLAAYCIVEPLLMTMCGRTREESIFCVPYYRSPVPLQQIRKVLYEQTEMWERISKYSALNLGCLRTYGTIEFRQAPLWRRREEASAWLSVVEQVVANGRKRNAQGWLDRWAEVGIEALIKEILPYSHKVLVKMWAEETGLQSTDINEHFTELDIPKNIGLLIGSNKKLSRNFVWVFQHMKGSCKRAMPRKSRIPTGPLLDEIEAQVPIGGLQPTSSQFAPLDNTQRLDSLGPLVRAMLTPELQENYEETDDDEDDGEYEIYEEDEE